MLLSTSGAKKRGHCLLLPLVCLTLTLNPFQPIGTPSSLRSGGVEIGSFIFEIAHFALSRLQHNSLWHCVLSSTSEAKNRIHYLLLPLARLTQTLNSFQPIEIPQGLEGNLDTNPKDGDILFWHSQGGTAGTTLLCSEANGFWTADIFRGHSQGVIA